jgi:predicted dithiol-disulfide oxidoreductase (DUF899 family)
MSEQANRKGPVIVDRARFDEELEALRAREKAHTREGDAIAAARRRLPMVEVAADSALLGPDGPVTLLDAFEGRRQLIAYYFMWWPGRPAAEQCEGCTWVMSHVGELAYLHSPRLGHATRTLGGAPQWPPVWEWPGGRPTAQWPRVDAGCSDDLGAIGADPTNPPHHCH